MRSVQGSVRCQSAIRGRRVRAVSGDCRDQTGRRDPANALVVHVGDVEVPSGIGGKTGDGGEGSIRGRASIASEADDSVPSDGGDYAVGGDLADPWAVGEKGSAVPYKEIARAIKGDPLGK